MRTLLVALVALVASLALVPTAEAGQPCTTPPKDRVQAVVWAAECRAEDLRPLLEGVAIGTIVVDLRGLNACPGPWGHEETTVVGPIVVVTYECDDGGV